MRFLTSEVKQPQPLPTPGLQRIRGASKDYDGQAGSPADGLGAEERQALYDAVVQEMIKVGWLSLLET